MRSAALTPDAPTTSRPCRREQSTGAAASCSTFPASRRGACPHAQSAPPFVLLQQHVAHTCAVARVLGAPCVPVAACATAAARTEPHPLPRDRMATATATRPPAVALEASLEQSLALVQNLLRAGVSEIAYLRNFFDEPCFSSSTLGATKGCFLY